MNALSLARLEFRRPGGFALGPLSLELRPGSRTALVGKSGAGKSTLLRLIAGFERPTSGSIALAGRVAFEGRERLAPHQRGIGFVFQSGGLWPHLDALQHLRFAARRLSDAEARALLQRVGLAGKEHAKPRQLSGGEAQRLQLARALAARPALLLLDEPLRSLDVHLRPDLALLIQRSAAESGATVLSVTHDREEALLLADDAVVMDAGRIAERGTLAELERAPATAHAAALLCGATCFRLEGDAPTVETPFGAFARPAGAAGALALAVLPGDVLVGANGSGVAGRVLFSEADGATVRLHVEALDARFVVPHRASLPAGEAVRLVLAGSPRILPWATAEEQSQ